MLKPTPEQDAAGTRVINAKLRKESKEAVGNLLSLISTFAAFVAPLVLSISTGNWGNLFLILLYPCALFSMSWVKHSFNQNLFKIFVPAIVLILFMSISNAPTWYWFIGLGLIGSYHILLNELPIAQMKLEAALGDPAYQEWVEKVKAQSIEE